MSARWIRLDTTWSSSEWLAVLEAEARLCWVELLCYIKAHGTAGRCKRLTPVVFGRVTGVTRDAFACMEKAAIADDALRIEGDEWVVTGWDEHQSDPTAADRAKRYRQRRQRVTEKRDVTRDGRDGRDVTRDVTSTETETGEASAGARGGAPAREAASPTAKSQPPGERFRELAAWLGGDIDEGLLAVAGERPETWATSFGATWGPNGNASPDTQAMREGLNDNQWRDVVRSSLRAVVLEGQAFRVPFFRKLVLDRASEARRPPPPPPGERKRLKGTNAFFTERPR